MKRIWFAILFLTIAAAACVFEQSYINGFCRDMNSLTATAVTALENGDGESFTKTAEKIRTLWDKKNDILFALSGHVMLDELSTKINALEGKNEHIYDIRAIIKAYYEDNRIKFANIL